MYDAASLSDFEALIYILLLWNHLSLTSDIYSPQQVETHHILDFEDLPLGSLLNMA